MNQDTRQAILERDNYTCQFDLVFGISELTGVHCSQDLEIHHKRYPHRTEDDLVTICVRCHELLTDGVRHIRYQNQAESVFPHKVPKKLPARGKGVEKNDDQDVGCEIPGGRSVDLPQRKNCKSVG